MSVSTQCAVHADWLLAIDDGKPTMFRNRYVVIEGNEIVGRITSVAHRTTLGQPIALAFVRPRQVAAGTQVTIRVDAGKLLTASVVPLPFYDPDALRQRLPD